MRHRFHSICPYFAMFPECFVEKHLAASRYNGIVFDPYCGRGTTVFQALLQGRAAAGCDLNPVAVCVSGAKSNPPGFSKVRTRLNELRQGCYEPDDLGWQGSLGEFFDLCFHRDTLLQVRYLRSVLDWRNRKDDRFIAALCLGALHGESPPLPQLLQQPHAPHYQHEAGLFDSMVEAIRKYPAAAGMSSRSSNGCSNTGSGPLPRRDPRR